jgi:hypothetical protein
MLNEGGQVVIGNVRRDSSRINKRAITDANCSKMPGTPRSFESVQGAMGIK